jgi:D-alanyl-D-alanine carboxypeptidase
MRQRLRHNEKDMFLRRIMVVFCGIVCLFGAMPVLAQEMTSPSSTESPATSAVPMVSSSTTAAPEISTPPLPAVASSTVPVPPPIEQPPVVVEHIFPARPNTYIPAAREFVSAMVIRPSDKKALYEYEADKSWTAASLTKIPNALAFVSRNPNWGKAVTLSSKDEVGGGRLRVNVGTRFTVRDLFYASLTASANNAAMALARSAGLTYQQFITRMNQEAKKAGALHSTFVDASGMDPRNKTTARDMAMISLEAFKQARIRSAATSAEYSLKVLNNGQVRKVKNTNALLIDEHNGLWVTGGKTGYLEESMYNLVTQVRPMGADGRPDRKKEILLVVFGAPTKEGSFTSTKKLAEWVWAHYEF